MAQMRRGRIGAAAAAAAGIVFIVGIGPQSAAAEQQTVSAAGSAAASIQATLESIASTGWQFVAGTYLLGGELLETGRILTVNTAAVLGLVTIPTVADADPNTPPTAEPQTTSSPTANSADSASSIEDRRLAAWSNTGIVELTPSLATPANRTAAAAPLPTIVAPGALAAAGRGTDAPAVDRTGEVRLETVALGAVSKPGGQPAASSTCEWPDLSTPADPDTEAATLATISRLGLMKEPAIRLPDGSVFLPKVTQRLLQIRTGFTCRGMVSSSRSLAGHVIADPTSSGLVQSSQDGRIEATDWGLPRLGQAVTEGEILGYLRPIWSNRDRAELEAAISTLRGEIAEKELELARSRELPFLPFRQGRILSIRLELDKLRRHRDALVEGLEGADPIIASVSGVIARAEVRVGQVVEARQILWEIVDERRLWVEAEWFGAMPPGQIEGATALRADGTAMPLIFEGSGWSLSGQSTPIQFRIERPGDGVRIGERLTVLVREAVGAEGMLVPKSALVRRPNGETGVWAATSAELFESHRVRWKAVDGHVIAIEAGLPEGARVVIGGAPLLSEVR